MCTTYEDGLDIGHFNFDLGLIVFVAILRKPYLLDNL